MDTVQIRPAVRSDAEALTAVVSAAFADDPVQRWLFDGADDYDDARTAFFALFVDAYLALDTVTVAVDTRDVVVGAALWAAPGRVPLTDDLVTGLVTGVTAAVGDAAVGRLLELARANDYRPPRAHWYLGILGVDPSLQSHGVGGQLLADGLARSDKARAVSHLESSNPRNVGFYERHGFAVGADYRCGGEQGPLMTIMSRSFGTFRTIR